MFKINGLLRLAGAAAFATAAAGSAALADGMAAAEAPAAEEGRKFEWSVTVSATSDYLFRGISTNCEDPAFQPSIDASYGILYAGIWGSNVCDESNPAEVDLYAGIKPVLGPVTFDFGVIYYWYPNGDDTVAPGELDYVELKAGASGEPVKNLSVGVTFYWTPDYFEETGDVWTVEGNAGYTLPEVGIFTPTISGVLGYVESEELDAVVTGVDNYTYWNVGLALEVEKFTFDFRYWDTDVPASSEDHGITDERFVFTTKVTLP
ncbi:MAG TPA: TorF family putative porin [Hyphomicrobiaceae bacterium]|nr:TorF family putative porin [Hyphomicrobiaceae bacterium]